MRGFENCLLVDRSYEWLQYFIIRFHGETFEIFQQHETLPMLHKSDGEARNSKEKYIEANDDYQNNGDADALLDNYHSSDRL